MSAMCSGVLLVGNCSNAQCWQKQTVQTEVQEVLRLFIQEAPSGYIYICTYRKLPVAICTGSSQWLYVHTGSSQWLTYRKFIVLLVQ